MKTSQSLLFAASAASLAHAFTWQQPQGQQPFGTYFGLPGQDAVFDYVVVGGGTAGLVVAERLAETGKVSVAVIEAGSFYEFTNSNQSQIPYFSRSSVPLDPDRYFNGWVDWDLVTVPQPVCAKA
jgi:choline dehydrogenase